MTYACILVLWRSPSQVERPAIRSLGDTVYGARCSIKTLKVSLGGYEPSLYNHSSGTRIFCPKVPNNIHSNIGFYPLSFCRSGGNSHGWLSLTGISFTEASAGNSLQFSVVDSNIKLGTNEIALKGKNGKFCTGAYSDDGAMKCNRDTFGPSEIFHVTHLKAKQQMWGQMRCGLGPTELGYCLDKNGYKARYEGNMKVLKNKYTKLSDGDYNSTKEKVEECRDKCEAIFGYRACEASTTGCFVHKNTHQFAVQRGGGASPESVFKTGMVIKLRNDDLLGVDQGNYCAFRQDIQGFWICKKNVVPKKILTSQENQGAGIILSTHPILLFDKGSAPIARVVSMMPGQVWKHQESYNYETDLSVTPETDVCREILPHAPTSDGYRLSQCDGHPVECWKNLILSPWKSKVVKCATATDTDRSEKFTVKKIDGTNQVALKSCMSEDNCKWCSDNGMGGFKCLSDTIGHNEKITFAVETANILNTIKGYAYSSTFKGTRLTLGNLHFEVENVSGGDSASRDSKCMVKICN